MNAIHVKLTAAILGLLVASAAFFLFITIHTTETHRDEVAQRLHRTLASSLVAESPLFRDGDVEPGALEHVFHTLMVVNPSIEVYLLDDRGGILRYSAPEGRVVLERVDLAPLHRLFATGTALPVLGDDPRHPDTPKVFSAAPIVGDDGVEGYLYIVLHSELRADAEAGGWGSALGRLTAGGVFAILIFGIGSALSIHALLTRRLRRLSSIVDRLQEDDFRERPDGLVGLADPEGDEIGRLAASFHRMADRIVDQVQALRDTDEHRRQLIANVSHDLRTPLAALQGYLETMLLKDDEVDAAERRSYLEIASKSGARLSRLVDELFELAKLEACTTPPNLEPFPIAELVHDVLQKFALRARDSGIELVVDVDDEAIFATAELGLIERLLENLVDNALRHTPHGGRVRLLVTDEADRIEVVVTDTGSGIPACDLPHIFDRFYRSSGGEARSSSGAGLGLAIAKRIVELHHGTLRASSRVGHGTQFSFELPAAS